MNGEGRYKKILTLLLGQQQFISQLNLLLMLHGIQFKKIFRAAFFKR